MLRRQIVVVIVPQFVHDMSTFFVMLPPCWSNCCFCSSTLNVKYSIKYHKSVFKLKCLWRFQLWSFLIIWNVGKNFQFYKMNLIFFINSIFLFFFYDWPYGPINIFIKLSTSFKHQKFKKFRFFNKIVRKVEINLYTISIVQIMFSSWSMINKNCFKKKEDLYQLLSRMYFIL